MSHPRPLSPHLQIYQPQITWLLSITHRLTGMALTCGIAMFVWWLMAIASGPESYRIFQEFAGSWIGQLMLIGWTWALYFHLMNGVRHLAWDVGYGFSLKTVYYSGWGVIGASIVLTIGTWIFVWL